jgi:hypothetical protein
MHLPGMYGKGQEVLVLDESIVKAEAITDDHVLRAENRARKVTTIGAAKDLNQVLFALETTHQLMYQLNVFHEISNFLRARRHTQSNTRAIFAPTTKTLFY